MPDLFSSDGSFNLNVALGQNTIPELAPLSGPPLLPGGPGSGGVIPGNVGLTENGHRALMLVVAALVLWWAFYSRGRG